jgi:hypothetical protein
MPKTFQFMNADILTEFLVLHARYMLLSFYILFYSDLFLPACYWCRGLLLHLITHTHTNKLSTTPLDEELAFRKDLST